MAAPHSTEACQGSAGAESGSRPPTNSAIANARISLYINDPVEPVNATLQLGVSQRDHTAVLGTVDAVFSRHHQADATRRAGGHVEGSQSA